ncbi:CLUMA_CG012244, isoform A [Clunio marinus]|uniref:CLUMA_CG012244, isoform A n=1 Tax=Clunio marinus TaxID=568069 RepID=A0A1J1IFY8_9DIPT|nr:CLUMA_CG012244, isoform A [Clunio marinus]
MTSHLICWKTLQLYEGSRQISNNLHRISEGCAQSKMLILKLISPRELDKNASLTIQSLNKTDRQRMKRGEKMSEQNEPANENFSLNNVTSALFRFCIPLIDYSDEQIRKP